MGSWDPKIVRQILLKTIQRGGKISLLYTVKGSRRDSLSCIRFALFRLVFWPARFSGPVSGSVRFSPDRFPGLHDLKAGFLFSCFLGTDSRLPRFSPGPDSQFHASLGRLPGLHTSLSGFPVQPVFQRSSTAILCRKEQPELLSLPFSIW